MTKFAITLALAAGLFTAGASSAWAQASAAEPTRAQVKAQTAKALRNGTDAPMTEVDPENQKAENPPARPRVKAKRVKKAPAAASAAS